MVERITSRSRQIVQFPSSGQMVPEYQDPAVREVVEGQYRVIYEVTAQEIHVLAVIHGAQLLPPEPPRETSA
jgi:plasmid stabilization system protein ParE